MPSLRERRADVARESILTALTDALDGDGPARLTMSEIARRAGVSRRTLYRYFPDRAAVLAACRERVERRLGLSTEVATPEEIVANFAAASRQLERSPDLVRALTQAAVRAKKASRPAPRVEAIRAALVEVTDGLGPSEVDRAAGVIAHLCSGAGWLALTDEADLNPEQARRATAWAVGVLIEDLRRRSAEPHSNEV